MDAPVDGRRSGDLAPTRFGHALAAGRTGEELASDRLKAKLGAALIERDLLHEKIALLEVDRPFARRRRKP